jgi:hypothetical protein
VGQEIALYCNVSGEPTPQIIWYKDADEIQPSERVEINGKYYLSTQ